MALSFVLSMYGLPVIALLYSLALTLVTWFIYLLLKGIKYVRRCRQLQSLENEVLFSLERLEVADDLVELTYQKLLRQVHEEKVKIASLFDGKQVEQNMYYTLWAHQIKTPISALDLLFQASEAPKEMRAELAKIEEYVEMVLYYLRLETINTALNFEAVPIEFLVKKAVKKYAGLFVHKKISLQLMELEGEVLSDSKWLVFVMEQLIANALKYTESGTISIQFKADILCIEDTGIGILETDLPRIFERGFTGYNGRMDKQSTGIGLFLCRQIMEKLGHGLRIESERGKGTVVYLDLGRNLTKVKD